MQTLARFYEFMLRREMQIAQEADLYIDEGKLLILAAIDEQFFNTLRKK